jgi:hypothetical protein
MPPPVLASRALLEDIAPMEPGRLVMQYLAIGGGLMGAVLEVVWGIEHTDARYLVAMLFLAICAAGLLPMRYGVRALAVSICTAGALVVHSIDPKEQLLSGHSPVLSFSMVLLVSALWFRATYRASRLSRFLVALGVVTSALWWVIAEGFNVPVLDTEWTSWAPVGLRVTFGILLLLSLLAFMGPVTTGGCEWWGALLLAWHSVYLVLEIAIAVSSGSTRMSFSTAEAFSSGLAIVLCVWMLSTGFWQILADAAGRRRGQWNAFGVIPE